MRLMYQWLGAEIVLVHVGHGLLGAGVVVILALNLPLWFMAALVPLVVFSVWGWFQEASLVMPVARRYLSGDPFPAGKEDEQACEQARGELRTGGELPSRSGQVKT